jgi:Skp family chaperone for outer membrane proteins
MKRYLIFFFICSTLSIHANARKVQSIAVYNVDSVLVTLPEYNTALKEYTQSDSVINFQLSQMDTEYQRKITELNTDSAKWRPLILEIKKKEIKNLGENIREFREQLFIEREEKKKSLRAPLEKKIAEAAAIIGKEKGFIAVISIEGYGKQPFDFSGGLSGYTKPAPSLLNETISQPVAYQDPKIKTVNITSLLIEKLKRR